jgi:tol-pal system beta propeller repeat protein TolB
MLNKFIQRLFTFDGLILTGLGCSTIFLLAVILSFFTLWRRFPAAREATVSEVLLPTQAVTQPVPSPVLPTQPIPEQTLPPPTPTPPVAQLIGKIVYVCYLDGFDEICRMDSDGSNQTRLTYNPATDFYPALSTDGQTIVFSSRRDGRFEIYEMSLDGRMLTRLTQEIGSAFAPTISPDGQLIAFTNVTSGNQSIWLMTRDAEIIKPLTDSAGEDIDPTWSPDGRFIAFASDRGGGGTQLYIIDLNSLEIRQVTFNVANIGGRNDWSRDGQFLSFYAGEPGSREIYTVNINTGALLQLTNGGDNLAPSYSPDGNWIVFTSYRDGNNEIYRMRTDGSQVLRLTNNQASDWQPRWGP